MAEWYYIGHYGQLGPLTHEQVDELIEGGVIARDTYLWRAGMQDWVPAASVSEFDSSFRSATPYSTPPPPPMPTSATTPANMGTLAVDRGYGAIENRYSETSSLFGTVRSDRSRIAAGILNLVIPGVGRMYLGYMAHGVLQLILSLCGVGYIWSIIDGIIILTGGVKLDGYGRRLMD